MTIAPLRLLIVDDHSLFRRGLKAVFEEDLRFTIVGEAADAGRAIELTTQLQPDVVLLDIHLPGVTGIEALLALRESAPLCKILMLTVSEDEQLMTEALRLGADGYLLKTIHMNELTEAIVRVTQGDSVISPEMTGKLVAMIRAGGKPLATTLASQGLQAMSSIEKIPPAIEQLSPREREILKEIVRGSSNKEIARTCDIAETTVKIHVQHILRKLKVSSRVQAAVVAAPHL